MPEFRQPVDSLAKHIGMSIRATGKAKEGEAEGRKGALIQELSRGLSVDYVTTPGAGGQILQLFEAARSGKFNSSEGDSMTDDEKRQLREAQASARRANERLALMEATPAIDQYFSTVRVGEAIQARVKGRILAGAIPLKETGELDTVKLAEIAKRETEEEVAYVERLTGQRIVIGMGESGAPQLTEAQRTEQAATLKEEQKRFGKLFGLKTKAGRKIMSEGRAAFDPEYNAGAGELVTSGAKVAETGA
jgi:hypothetical protein